MIGPIRSLMRERMGLHIQAQEYQSGYGIADLVGAEMSHERCQSREHIGLTEPLDPALLAVLHVLRTNTRTSLARLLGQCPVAESSLRNRILPRLSALGLIRRYPDGYVELLVSIPMPTRRIVAIEAKQTRWRQAILQARRYTFFANQSYIAVWNGTAQLVDRSMLYRHRLGLIGVDLDGAQVITEAPDIKPRSVHMNWRCAEFLYGRLLDATNADQSHISGTIVRNDTALRLGVCAV